MNTTSNKLTHFGLPALFGALIAWLYLQHTEIQQLKQNRHLPAYTQQASIAQGYAHAVNQALPAVVNIYSLKRVQEKPRLFQNQLLQDPFFKHFFNYEQSPRERIASSLGSGVIVNNEGYLLTNYHVIKGADEIIVLLHDGRESRAKLIGSDPEIDLAVLKIELDQLHSIHFASIDNAAIGDIVLAIGNPFGLGQTVTQGIISATSRQGLSIASNYIQTDAAINQGNSGGALINAAGELVGINTVIYSQTGSSIGIGFAIPVDTAIKVLNDIIQYGKVIRGSLGIVPKIVPEKMAQTLQLEKGTGILITAIYRNGAAHRAGIMPGDIITHVGDTHLYGDQTGLDTIAKTTPGKKTTVTLIRGQQQYQLSITPSIR